MSTEELKKRLRKIKNNYENAVTSDYVPERNYCLDEARKGYKDLLKQLRESDNLFKMTHD